MDALAWSGPLNQVLATLGTDPEKGLSGEEAERRQKRDGPNALKPEEKASRLRRFFNQFRSPVVLTLLAATVVSAVLGETVDAAAIAAIVLLNGMIGYLQEVKAEAAVEALKKLAAPKARVLRDGQVAEILAADVCAGDVLVLEAGDYVAADGRILEAHQLSADEALLTGESVPVRKAPAQVAAEAPLGDRGNMLFGGTAVTTGSGRAVVTAIGGSTEIGKIAGMLESAEKGATPLQSRLEEVGSKLLILCLAVVIVVGILGWIHGEKWLNVLMTGIGLAVAAIPEGLPAVVTMALALAIRRMAKRNAIVRHLPAVETLGSTDVICTDKTGTLTTGRMRARELVLPGTPREAAEGVAGGAREKYRGLIQASVACSNASLTPDGQAAGDPTEVALLHLSRDFFNSAAPRDGRRMAEWTFDSLRKRMSVAVAEPDGVRLYCKGAPESVLPLCRFSNDSRGQVEEELRSLSSKGRRLLAVAKRDLARDAESFRAQEQADAGLVERDLELLGLVAIADPPRTESIAAIRSCQAAGIRVVMITGDHPLTAKAIAAELGIVEPERFEGVLTGPELDRLPFEELKKKVVSVAVYARVTPEHKLKIVEAWKANGAVVAMTGDGVNDAPALKAASIGVSMGRGGTEVARQASSMILADDNFATIVSAVEEGRAIYGNIRRTIQYLLSGNLAEILIMLGAAVVGWPVPLAAIHLLWINLVTDGLPSLALAAEPVPARILESSGRPSPKNFFDKFFYREMLFVGVTVAAMALAVYGYSLKFEDELTAKTHVFSFLVFAELFRSFACRSEAKTFFQLGLFSNVYHLLAVAVPIGFQLLLHHTSWFEKIFDVRMISLKECLVMFGLTLIPVSVLEIRKWARQRAS